MAEWMVDNLEITGLCLRLRLVVPEDARFIHALRTDPAYNSHLSPVTGTVTDQRRWIENYKIREAAGAEFYYVIERLDGTPCGVVRLYDIAGDSFTWGSWILDHNKPPKAALESAVLSFGIGFEGLGLHRALIDVRKDNTHATAFYRRFGMTETGADTENLYFMLSRDDFRRNRDSFMNILQEQPT
ncbi:Protein N-acetyltransferase, RimJ/RimL family [Roseovarius marisflavi]|uniref:Protein N-acetyltransferase, RimJ/RimL family n=1 Tax=Roseovarius marisflavi TaxID=1054996 RepID=A0A1M7CGR2_9RHOB|nr:GNAT family N-acetyltransferase [Roseovarius marisflavi]SHL66019.1 Protein N-acetyltransferase, RimJ/RimL family [Roseovarius marisflavi]